MQCAALRTSISVGLAREQDVWFGGEAIVALGAALASASDDFRVRRLRVGARLLAQLNAKVCALMRVSARACY